MPVVILLPAAKNKVRIYTSALGNSVHRLPDMLPDGSEVYRLPLSDLYINDSLAAFIRRTHFAITGRDL
jgi:hypothetical protein